MNKPRGHLIGAPEFDRDPGIHLRLRWEGPVTSKFILWSLEHSLLRPTVYQVQSMLFWYLNKRKNTSITWLGWMLLNKIKDSNFHVRFVLLRCTFLVVLWCSPSFKLWGSLQCLFISCFSVFMSCSFWKETAHCTVKGLQGHLATNCLVYSFTVSL